VTPDDLAEVVRLERRTLDPGVRADGGQLLALLHPGFREHGASGRVWTRDDVLEALSGPPVDVEDLQARALGADAALVTYRSDAGGRRALRSSVWVRDGGTWRLVFHAGTPLPP
jgi:ribonuclease HI